MATLLTLRYAAGVTWRRPHINGGGFTQAAREGTSTAFRQAGVSVYAPVSLLASNDLLYSVTAVQYTDALIICKMMDLSRAGFLKWIRILCVLTV